MRYKQVEASCVQNESADARGLNFQKISTVVIGGESTRHKRHKPGRSMTNTCRSRIQISLLKFPSSWSSSRSSANWNVGARKAYFEQVRIFSCTSYKITQVI